MATIALNNDNFETTISDSPIVLVDFWAPWCVPCQHFGPVFEESSNKHADVVFAKVNTEDEQQIAMAAQITSIPTIMAFRDGIAIFRQSGALPGPALEELIDQIKTLDMDEVRKQVAETSN